MTAHNAPTEGFHAQVNAGYDPNRQVATVGGNVDAGAASWHETLVYADRFRQDRFFLSLFALLVVAAMVCVTYAAVKMAAMKAEYQELWPRRKRGKGRSGKKK